MTDRRIILHLPIRPPRDGVIGECVFSQHWQELMAGASAYPEYDHDYNDPNLGRILDRHDVTQADATICATLIQWLGTNVGRCTLDRGRQLGNQIGRSTTFLPVLAAWAADNLRSPYRNGNRRLLECLMVDPDAARDWAGSPLTVPALTLKDFETAELLMAWLDNAKGLEFTERAEGEIKIRLDAERHYRRGDRRAGGAA